MGPVEAEVLRVEVVYCPAPGRIDQVLLLLPPGASVAQALAASGVLQRHALAHGELSLGLWSRRCEPGSGLRDRDRVEIYRPLSVDPKEARRLRYKRAKGAKGAKPAG